MKMVEGLKEMEHFWSAKQDHKAFKAYFHPTQFT